MARSVAVYLLPLTTDRGQPPTPGHQRPTVAARPGTLWLVRILRWTVPLRLLIFPIFVSIAFVTLVALNLNGSSIGVMASPQQLSESLVAGQPRPIRADEWRIATPISISQARTGFPTDKWVGLTDTAMTVFNGGPSASYTEIFKPQDWGYFFLGPDRGLAFHWWLPFALCLIGFYVLFLMFRAPLPVAIAGAVVGSFTPYTAWWTAALPAVSIGAVVGAAICATLAIRARRMRNTALWSLGIAYFAAMAVFVSYPAWTVALGWVLLGMIAGQLIDWRVGWRRIGTMAGVVIVGSVLALIPWFLANSAALKTIASTIYPGRRVAEAGLETLADLLDAPLNIWYSTANPKFLPDSNLSEVSSPWIPLPIVLVAAIFALWLLRRDRRPPEVAATTEASQPPVQGQVDAQDPIGRWTVLGTCAGTLLVLAWALLPLPKLVGTLTVLSVTPAERAQLAVGFGALLLTVFCSSIASRRKTPMVWIVILAVAVAATVATTIMAATDAPIAGKHPGLGIVLINSLILGLGFAFVALGKRTAIAAVVLASYCFVSFALVNPLYQGIEPLSNGGVSLAAAAFASQNPDAKIALFGQDDAADVQVRASQAALISELTFYPDADLMNKLAPGQEALWNNFVHYTWVADPGAATARIEPLGADSARIYINPCLPATRSIGITWFGSSTPLNIPCLVEAKRTVSGAHTLIWYQYE